MKRIVLYSKTDGVYLGSFIGLGFWSKLDPAGQPCACTFESKQDAQDYVNTWECNPPADMEFREVTISDTKEFSASISEIVAGGMDAWDPNEGMHSENTVH